MLDSITNRLDNITNRLDNVIVRLVAYYIAISLFFESILRLSLGHRTMSFILAISSPLQSGPEIGSLEAVELKLFCMLFCRNRFFRLGFRRFVLCLGIPVT